MMRLGKLNLILLLSFFMMLYFQKGYTQQDTLFWFVAPEVAASHGDAPIQFVLTTGNSDADIEISQPANSGFPKIKLRILKNSVKKVDLTPYLNSIENRPYNRVLNKGLLIESTEMISAYYEVSNNVNPEIFPLKGNNALGTKYYIPSQNDYPNSPHHGASESIDIVATQNATTITITPTCKLLGIGTKNPVTIVLNKGQTYNVRAIDLATATTFAGTKVTSNKPICITISDDSVYKGAAQDLIGDQLIPVDLIGDKYIAVKGFSHNEKVYFQSVSDNTEIKIDGEATPSITLNEGEHTSRLIPGDAMYIESSKPLYVYHVSGQSEELGSAILPQIKCTGSYNVGFVRSAPFRFSLFLLTRQGNEGAFEINGNTTAIKASDFNLIGTTGWMVARLDMSTAVVPLGVNTILNRSGSFHVGILNRLGGSSEYGYFSNYATFTLGRDFRACALNNPTLDAGAGRDSYTWSTGESTQTININKTGKYWVTIKEWECVMSDTIDVGIDELNFKLPNDTTICNTNPITVSSGVKSANYVWSSGETSESITTNASGEYSVEVTKGLCNLSDTINLTFHPETEVSNDTTICFNRSATLSVKTPRDSYLWKGGSTTPRANFSGAGEYWVETKQGSCNFRDTVKLNVVTYDLNLGNDTTICNTRPISINSGLDLAKYNWSSGETTKSISTNTSGKYFVDVEKGVCNLSDTINLTFYPETEVSNDTTICFNRSATLSVKTPRDSYLWKGGSTTPSANFSGAGEYWVETKQGSCNFRDTVKLNVVTYDLNLGNDTTICNTRPISINSGLDLAKYNWSSGETTKSISTNTSGKYFVDIEKGVCNLSDTINLTFYPESKMVKDTSICEGETAEISINSGRDSYAWSTGSISNTAKLNKAGTYWVESKLGSCTFRDSVKLNIDNLHLDLGKDTAICSNDPVVISSKVKGDKYTWSNGDSDKEAYINYSGEYNVTVQKKSCIKSDTINVEINPIPEVTYIDYTDNMDLRIMAEYGTYPYQYSLDNKNYSKSGIFKCNSNKNYTIYVKDSKNCISKTSYKTKSLISADNFFTPNGDGINDEWVIKNIEKFPEAEVSIFNREGRLINKYNGNFTGWTGDGCSSDDYWYIIDLKNGDNVFVGHFSLKRQ